MEFHASAADSDWAAADLDAVMVPEPSVGLLLVFGTAGLVGLAAMKRARRP